jgi:AcrR family transcriptional regulator
MSGIREQKKQQTYMAIINAAIRLFTEKGYEETSMEELARSAGVGKSTIYGYFKTKDDIFLAFCDAELDFAFSELDRKIDENASLVDQLVAQMMGQITYVTKNREFGRIFVREMAFPGANAMQKTNDIDKRYVGKLVEVLGAAQQRGELPEETDLLLMMAHFHALSLMVLSTLYTGDVTSLENAEIFLRALVIQTLHGPAALAELSGQTSREWNDIKQLFLERHNLEL